MAKRKPKKQSVKRKEHHMTRDAKIRRSKIKPNSLYSPERGKLFCITLADTCNVGKAAASIGVTRKTVYNWRDEHAEFHDEWDKAKAIGITVLEDEATRRAGPDGVQEPVFYRGKKIADVNKHSDTLLTFLLSAHKGDVYGKQRTEITGKDGDPLIPSEVRVRFVPATLEKVKK